MDVDSFARRQSTIFCDSLKLSEACRRGLQVTWRIFCTIDPSKCRQTNPSGVAPTPEGYLRALLIGRSLLLAKVHEYERGMGHAVRALAGHTHRS
jgi:hypothetical protein